VGAVGAESLRDPSTPPGKHAARRTRAFKWQQERASVMVRPRCLGSGSWAGTSASCDCPRQLVARELDGDGDAWQPNSVATAEDEGGQRWAAGSPGLICQRRREMLLGTCRTRMAKAQFARFLYYYAYWQEQVNNCTSIFVQKKNCTSIYVPVGCYMCLGVGLIPASASGVSYKSRCSSRIIS